jgi:hypothetical protein
MNAVRYHLQLNSHRTTISLDKILSDLIAIKLGAKPGTKEAHSIVRNQLAQFISHDRGRAGHGLGRYLTEHAVLFVSDKILSDKYWEHWTEEYEKAEKLRLK